MKNIPKYMIDCAGNLLLSDYGDVLKFEDFERYCDDIRMENNRLIAKLQRASKMILKLKMENKRLESKK